MFKKTVLYTVPSACAVLATSFALVACGGSSDSTGSSELAKFAPADSLFFADATVRPTGDVAANVDAIATKLTGSTISDQLTEALDDQTGSKSMNYDADIKPWLGENVAVFGKTDLSNTSDLLAEGMPGAAAGATMMANQDETYGIVAESTDDGAAQSFITKAAEGEDTTENEYEGNSYLIDQQDDTALGIVDSTVVAASDEAQFKAIVDASSGDSLADATGYKEVSGEASDESVFDIYTANEPILKASGEDQFPGIKDIYSAMGIDIADSASLVSMVPGKDQMSLETFTNTDSDIVSGDATDLISSFPADSVFAAGTAGIGENITKIIDSIDETGIEGVVEPGELKKNLDEASQGGLDVRGLISSINELGFFVSGTTTENLGGALVLTTDDPEPIKNALGSFSSLAGLAQDAKVKPLSGGQTGFSVKTPELPGRPVIVALKGDRLVLAIGTPAANQVLDGNGDALADSTAFKDAQAALGDNGMDMFANASSIATLIGEQGAEGSKEAADFFNKFDFMTGGHGESDNSLDIIAKLK